MEKIQEYQENIFESINYCYEYGNEYWEARELQQLLGYKEWMYFSAVIEKAKISYSKSNNSINSNFGVNTKIVKNGVSTKTVIDYKLSRYACYLIVQNANPKLKAIALGQTYFAIQTRKMKLIETEYSKLTEYEKRLYRRRQTKDGNKVLYRVAKEKGVKNFDKFTNAGYKDLYNGETADDIAKRKGEDILDNMGSLELATDTHYKVGKEVRDTIKRLGVTIARRIANSQEEFKAKRERRIKKDKRWS